MAVADSEARAIVLLVENGAETVLARVHIHDGCDLAVLDTLLALCLVARRRGATIRLIGVHPDLVALSELLGVAGALGL